MTVKLLALDFNGVLDSNRVYILPDGSEAVRCYRGDGVGIERLRALGVPTIVISQETAPVIAHRCAKLGVTCWQGVGDKLAVLTMIATARGVSIDEIAYLGNDVNDLDCLKAVGRPYIVRDAEPALYDHGFRNTTRNGGEGAVRELCDLLADEIEQIQRPALSGLVTADPPAALYGSPITLNIDRRQLGWAVSNGGAGWGWSP